MGNTFFYNEARKEKSQITWKDIFSESFKKHTKSEMEYALSAGTGLNTATEETMLQQWQKPWLWVRVLGGGIVICILLYLAFLIPQTLSSNHSAYLALILINYITPPFVAVLVVMTLIWELNIPRNITIYSMLGYLILGGAFSIAFTQLFSIAGMPSGSAPLAPLTEEPGKCIAVAIFLALAARSKKKIYGLTGLLIGAGVGAGFTAFESIQYAFLYSSDVEQALMLAIRRSIPLFGGHILFCSPYAAGLALGYCRTGSWKAACQSKDFLIPFFCSCFGHFIWNYNATYMGYTILEWGIAAGMWFELLYMTRKCLRQAVQMGRYVPSSHFGSVSVPTPQPLLRQAVLTIYCVSGPLQGQSWRFEGGTLSIGREPGNTIQMPPHTQGVSRHHCHLQKTSEGWCIKDLNASYGTYLTDGKLPSGGRRPLRSGEIIYLGSQKIAFRVQID